MYKKGSIILIPFPFTDLSASKVRPTLILAESGNNIIVAFITSEPKRMRNKYAVILQSSDKNFELTGLKTKSAVLTDKIATLDKNIVLGELGGLPKKSQEKINTKLKNIFRL